MSVSINGTSGLVFNDASTQNTAATGFGFKNRLINSAMMIDQRNAGASVTPTVSGAYTLDRWRATLSVSSKYSVQQNAGSVTPPVGFTNYLGVTSLSAYSVGASEIFGMAQRIEGFNTADLGWGTANAQPVTLSFWVRSSLTGTFGGAIRNSAENRSYVFSYTVNSANTWEQKSITIAGDTSGTWVTNNGVGINLIFSLSSGSDSSTTAGSWVAGSFLAPTGSVSIVATNGATFYITGVQLEKGSTATAFDYRPYGTELALCQRYYEQSSQGNDFIWLGYCSSGITYYLSIPYKVTKRSTPTITVSSPGGNAFNTASLIAGDINIENFNASCSANGTSVGGFFYVRYKASAEL